METKKKISAYQEHRAKSMRSLHDDYHRLLDDGIPSLLAIDEVMTKHGIFHNSSVYRKLRIQSKAVVSEFNLCRDNGMSEEHALIVVKTSYDYLSDQAIHRILKKELEPVAV